MAESSRFVAFEPVDVELKSVGKKGFTTLIATGIVSPAGPTLNVVAADGYFPRAQGRIPILHLMLNPFSQTCRIVGAVDLRDEWSPVDDLEPFMSLEYGSCPTLLLPSIFNSSEGNELVYARLLRECDGGAGVLSRMEQYPGDPWSRVQDNHDTALRTDCRHKRFGTLDHVSALRLAKIQLQRANIEAELAAFLFAWDGAIKCLQKRGVTSGYAMAFEAFVELFARLTITCDLPTQASLARYGGCRNAEPLHARSSARVQ
jgi:hypothetical protein